MRVCATSMYVSRVSVQAEVSSRAPFMGEGCTAAGFIRFIEVVSIGKLSNYTQGVSFL